MDTDRHQKQTMTTRLIENLALRYQGLMLLLFPRSTAESLGKCLAPAMRKELLRAKEKSGSHE